MTVLQLLREPDWLTTVTHLLDARALIVYPTDTAYALGGDALDEEAVTHVIDTKGRPRDFSVPVIVGSVEDIRHVARMTPLGRRLAQRFLP
ncbi:MAG TPA: Sua5/YciO/YrdC/YwlC family protein, partial [Candidatus Thermoplasmatota archaeon]|nr:Sua5/YciO/YrdC/YwlC family protein [Candidatus Thermoplasmatota archaeon]